MRRCGPLALWAAACALLTLVGAKSIGADKAAQPDEWAEAKSFCRELGSHLHTQFPALCDHPVYWVIAVDVSGSFASNPAKMGMTKRLLQLWAQYVVVPGDKVRIVTFAKDLFPSKEALDANNNPDRLASDILNRLLDRERKRGTDVLKPRERVLELADKALPSCPGYQALTMVFTDEDATQGLNRSDASFPGRMKQRFGGRFAPGESADEPMPGVKPGEAVDGAWRFDDVWVFISGSVAANTGRKAMQARSLPMPESRRVEPPDPWAGVRILLWMVPWWLLAGVAYLSYRLWSADGGQLVNNGTGGRLRLPWFSVRHRPRDVYASHNRSGFCLKPERQGLAEPIVLQAKVENPWTVKPWTAHLKAADEQFLLADDTEQWDEQLILQPGREYRLKVKDRQGYVATGRVEFKPDAATRRAFRSAIALAGVLAAWLVLFLPYQGRVLQPPPPQRVDAEPLCH